MTADVKHEDRNGLKPMGTVTRFTGGTLPPKSAIREIRINSNPYSAEFDHLGYGRIEILTKPGIDASGAILASAKDGRGIEEILEARTMAFLCRIIMTRAKKMPKTVL